MPPRGRQELEQWCRADRDHLLEQFRVRFGRGRELGPPSEVLDDILTEILDFDLVEAELPYGELAVCDFDERRITLNTRLGDAVRPNTDLVALANSTKAHELGHIRMHEEELFLGTDRQTPSLFEEEPAAPRKLVTYRDEHRQRLSSDEVRREWEADLYAAVFLLPEKMLEARTEMVRIRRALREGRELSSNYLWRLNYALARAFRVSPTLMKNHLVRLKLVDYLPQTRQLRLSGQGQLL